MRQIVKIFAAFMFFLLYIGGSDVWAQCAMCRATVENNISNGDTSIGAGLNFGILYLFSMPYLIIAVVAYLWYRKSKADAKNKQLRRYSRG
ncbi:MAG: hypothetical protein WD555_02445 [Fulvivirga sp.]